MDIAVEKAVAPSVYWYFLRHEYTQYRDKSCVTSQRTAKGRMMTSRGVE